MDSEVAGLDQAVVDAAVGEDLEIFAHAGVLGVEHFPLAITELHLRIVERLLQFDCSIEKFSPLLEKAYLPKLRRCGRAVAFHKNAARAGFFVFFFHD